MAKRATRGTHKSREARTVMQLMVTSAGTTRHAHMRLGDRNSRCGTQGIHEHVVASSLVATLQQCQASAAANQGCDYSTVTWMTGAHIKAGGRTLVSTPSLMA